MINLNIGDEIDKTPFGNLEECPFLYGLCSGKDSTCLGDMKKFRECNLFLEAYLTAPPAGCELTGKL